MSAIGALEVAPALAVAGAIAYSWLAPLAREARRERASHRAHVRAARVYYAAIEAAEDDPSFAPEAIELAVLHALRLVDRAWRLDRVVPSDASPDAGLLADWARWRQAWLGRRLSIRGSPSVDLLRVVNREGETEDRALVRVRLRVHCRRPRLGLFGHRNMHLDERWTLGRQDGRWVVLSVEGDPLAGPVLTSRSIPNRSADDDRLLEESLVELADAQKVDDQAALAGLVPADEPADLAVLDLSLVDGRFLPPLIAAHVSHLLEAWEEAVDGSQQPLAALASAEATTMLLRPAADMRFILRDAVLASWAPFKLWLSRQPPAMDVKVDIEAIRYVVSDDGRKRVGNDTDRRHLLLAWRLELTGVPSRPWRLAATSNPGEAVPGWALR